MRHLFLDTNIILDVLTNRETYSTGATKLLDLGEKGVVEIYISALSYSNIYYILRKHYTHKEMITILRDVEMITTTLDVTKSIIRESIHSELKDFEDAIQLNCALSNKKIQAIVTRDSKGFKNNSLSVLTPDEVLSIIESIGS